jgi:neutral ceramidase
MTHKTILAAWIAVLILVAHCPESHSAAPWNVGAASVAMQADDSMVIGGSIGPNFVQGQEGLLQSTAVVIRGDNKALCLIAADVLMMHRKWLDQVCSGIEKECGIPSENILINASHTHHAPTTVSIHGYEEDEEFCKRTIAAMLEAAKLANNQALGGNACQGYFRLGQEATVGQNSRMLMKDGKIFWIGPRDEAVRPTDPFDVDLPVLAFRKPDGTNVSMLFNHSTHCIGTRTGKRSPSFYGLAAQELTEKLKAPVVFFSGAAGSTHNLTLDCNEMVVRIASAFEDTLEKVQPMESDRLASIKRELTFTMRTFDEQAEDQAVVDYCRKYAPQVADKIIDVFRESRRQLKPHQGETRSMWIQAMQIGDVYVVGVPAEFFTVLGLEIKRRSPFRNTFVFGLSNDYVGYLPNRAGFQKGGYQTWTGLHSFTEVGTGEMVVEATLKLLNELK